MKFQRKHSMLCQSSSNRREGTIYFSFIYNDVSIPINFIRINAARDGQPFVLADNYPVTDLADYL